MIDMRPDRSWTLEPRPAGNAANRHSTAEIGSGMAHRFRQQPSTTSHILIVDDHADGRETQRILLELLGHRVDTAAEGMEGARKAIDLRPDVAIVDIGLPGIDGFEVARRVRAELGNRIFLIALSAYSDPDFRQRGIDAGFDAYLVKPLDLDVLNHWLRLAAKRPG